MGCNCDNPLGVYTPLTPDRCAIHARSSGLRGRRAGMQVWAALLMTIAICAHAGGSFGDESVVPQARVDPKVGHLEGTEGTDIHFTRPSLAQGTSQTRVETIVQAERGVRLFGTRLD